MCGDHTQRLARLTVELDNWADIRTRALQETGIWHWDILADRLVWNDYMYTIYGIDRDSWQDEVHDGWSMLIHPDDRAGAESALQDAVGDPKYRFCTHFRRAIDSQVIFAFGHITFENGTAIRADGVNILMPVEVSLDTVD